MKVNTFPSTWPWDAAHYGKRSPSGERPAYERLKDELRAMIDSGQWRAGDLLPTEQNIAKATGLSASTIKRSLDELRQEGVLYRQQGAGTFVASTQLPSQSRRYYHLHRYIGDAAVSLSVHFLSLVSEMLSSQEAILLELAENEPCFRLDRLLCVDEIPQIVCRSWVPQWLFPGLDALTPYDFEHLPLYQTLEKLCEITHHSSNELVEALKAPADVAKLLRLRSGTPVLRSELVAYNQYKAPYELRHSYIATQRYRLGR